MQCEPSSLASRDGRAIRHGVTLIETILVITLLAAASVGGMMLFDGQFLARRQVKQVTVDVASALATARNTSINVQSTVRVTLGRKDGRQHLLIVEDAGPIRAGSSREIDLGSDATISGTPRTVQFHADGTADRNLNWKIGQLGVTGSVELTPVSGQITQTLP